MKQLTCEMCGSTDLLKEDGVFVCQSCGCKYSVEEAKKMMIEGTVEVKGNVKVDKSEDFNKFIIIAKHGLEDETLESGYNACEKALEINPQSGEAWLLKAEYLQAYGNKSTSQIISTLKRALEYSNNANKREIAYQFIERVLLAETSEESECDVPAHSYSYPDNRFSFNDRLETKFDKWCKLITEIEAITHQDKNHLYKKFVKQWYDTVYVPRVVYFYDELECYLSYIPEDHIKYEICQQNNVLCEYLNKINNEHEQYDICRIDKIQLKGRDGLNGVSVGNSYLMLFYADRIDHIPYTCIKQSRVKITNTALLWYLLNTSGVERQISVYRLVEHVPDFEKLLSCIEAFNKVAEKYAITILPTDDATNQAVPKKSGCYVATCVYGSYDCPEVWTLRRFRDDTLGSTWYGRLFIRTYYAISPTLVKWFGHTNWFKKMWKGKLDRMVAKLQSNGVENTPYQDKEW